MESYSDLISKVLTNKTLREAINEYSKDYLNLATTNWENDLKNNATYQNYLTPTSPMWKPPTLTKKYEFEKSKSSINVLLVARCIIYKNSHKPYVFIENSEPLSKIAQAMTSDIPGVKLSNIFKFEFLKCNPMKCSSCSENVNFRPKDEQSCIGDISVYDGVEIKNRFYSQVKKAFQEPFLAILRLNITTRYNYNRFQHQEDQSTNVGKLKGDTYKECRISGDVSHFIAFMESKILGSKVINIGTILPFEEECQKSSEESLDIKDVLKDLDDFPSLAYPTEKNNEKMLTNTIETDNNSKLVLESLQQHMIDNDNDSLEDLDDFIVEGSSNRKRKLVEYEDDIDQNKIFGDCETEEGSFLI